MTSCGSLRTAPSPQGTSPAPGVGRWGGLDVRSWREAVEPLVGGCRGAPGAQAREGEEGPSRGMRMKR